MEQFEIKKETKFIYKGRDYTVIEIDEENDTAKVMPKDWSGAASVVSLSRMRDHKLILTRKIFKI